MPERAEVPEGLLHPALVVEDDLPRRGDARKRVADGHRRDLARDRRPAAARRSDGDDDQPVDAVIDQALGELELAAGLAVGVGDEGAPSRFVELALDGAYELLVPEVAQAADEQADDRRRTAGERAGDRVGLVPELLGPLAPPPLGLGGHLPATERVADGGGREARVLSQL